MNETENDMDDLTEGCLALAKEMEGLAADHEAEVVDDPSTSAARGMASAYLLAAKWLRELVEANVEPGGECPAGGEHHYEHLVAEREVGLPGGWFCAECGAEAPESEPQFDTWAEHRGER